MVDEFNEYSEIDLAIDLVDFVLRLRPFYLKLPLFKDIRQMTYKNAIAYFIENEPPIPFEKGAMIIETESGEHNAFFLQIFLDKENKPVCDPVTGRPYGRRCLIRGMDDELASVFGDKKVVIVK